MPQFVGVEERILSAYQCPEPEQTEARHIGVDKRRRAEQHHKIARLAHRPHVRRHELSQPHRRAMAAVAAMPSPMIGLHHPIRCDVGNGNEGGFVQAAHARAPDAKLHVVVLCGPDSVLDAPEFWCETSDALEHAAPECEVCADETNRSHRPPSVPISNSSIKRRQAEWLR